MPDADFIGGMKRERQKAQPLAINYFKSVLNTEQRVWPTIMKLSFWIEGDSVQVFTNVSISALYELCWSFDSLYQNDSVYGVLIISPEVACPSYKDY